jgi:hypothetical protein
MTYHIINSIIIGNIITNNELDNLLIACKGQNDKFFGNFCSDGYDKRGLYKENLNKYTITYTMNLSLSIFSINKITNPITGRLIVIHGNVFKKIFNGKYLQDFNEIKRYCDLFFTNKLSKEKIQKEVETQNIIRFHSSLITNNIIKMFRIFFLSVPDDIVRYIFSFINPYVKICLHICDNTYKCCKCLDKRQCGKYINLLEYKDYVGTINKKVKSNKYYCRLCR